eukprot:10264401-Ditylum_brightwellii.AAC.1
MELAGDFFDPLKEAIHQHLLLALFDVHVIPEDLWDLMALPVQHGGVGALNPTKEAPQHRATSEACTHHLKETLIGLYIFEGDQHAACLKYMDGKKRKEEEYESYMGRIETFYDEDQCCSIERTEKAINNWLMVVPCTANNSVLNREEFRHQVLMQYIIIPKGLPTILA